MKIIFLLIIGVTIFTSGLNSIQAQDFSDSESIAYVDVKVNYHNTHNIQYDSKSNLSISNKERIAKAKAYDLFVSPEFGSYLNPYNGKLNIVNNNKKQFTKAQFLNESSNETIFSMSLDSETKTIDISKYKIGSYILILSNGGGDIFVENFIII